MLLRNTIIGLAALAAVAAEPPEKPLVDGREPDPVVQQFHAEETPTYGYAGGGNAPHTTRGNGIHWVGYDILGSLLRGDLTMQLGTVPMWD